MSAKINPIYLGVNIDHIATLRNARGTQYPDPVEAAAVAERAGADGITVHLREDRRHITDRDVALLSQTIKTRLNLEMAVTKEMLDIALRTQPAFCCLVPEKREELTTEGGLDVAGKFSLIEKACHILGNEGINVSLFIDADQTQIDAAIECGAPYIEIHTGQYADAKDNNIRAEELARLQSAVRYAHSKGLKVNAGHGLHYHNVQAVAVIGQIEELNIGHAIIARAAISGLANAVADMRKLMIDARAQQLQFAS